MQKPNLVKLGAWLAVFVAVFLIGFGAGYQYSERKQAVSQSESQLDAATSASLMIDYGNGTVSAFDSLPVSGSTTVFALLRSAAEANDINLGYKDFGGEFGAFIETINGVGKDPSGNKWWQYWVNNKYSQIGASSYVVRPGDVIEFKFIIGQK